MSDILNELLTYEQRKLSKEEKLSSVITEIVALDGVNVNLASGMIVIEDIIEYVESYDKVISLIKENFICDEWKINKLESIAKAIDTDVIIYIVFADGKIYVTGYEIYCNTMSAVVDVLKTNILDYDVNVDLLSEDNNEIIVIKYENEYIDEQLDKVESNIINA